MTAKWTTQQASGDIKVSPTPIPLEDQFVVLLLYGKNSFGDKIYSYVKINIPNLQQLKMAIITGKGFNPSDFGEVIAAGRGEPSPETRAEVASQYQVIDNSKPAANTNASAAPIPEEKKAWDEY